MHLNSLQIWRVTDLLWDFWKKNDIKMDQPKDYFDTSSYLKGYFLASVISVNNIFFIYELPVQKLTPP